MCRSGRLFSFIVLAACLTIGLPLSSQEAPRNEDPGNEQTDRVEEDEKDFVPTRPTGKPTPADSIEEIKSEIKGQTVTVQFEDTPLSEVIAFFRKRVSFNILVVPEVDTSRTVTITLHSLRLDRVMKLVLSQKGLSATYANGVVTIKPEGSVDNLQTQMFDIRDVQFQITDIFGPRLRLRQPESKKDSGTVGETEGSKMGSAFLKTKKPNGGRKKIISDPTKFKNLIKQLSGSEKDWNRKNARLEIKSQQLIVHQSPDVLKEIERLVNQLRLLK